MRTRLAAGLWISLTFLLCLEMSGAERGKYQHDTRGDTALPYNHDPAGDRALPYKHDERGDVALPYKHDTTGDSKVWEIYSSKFSQSFPGDRAEPYKKDSNGW